MTVLADSPEALAYVAGLLNGGDHVCECSGLGVLQTNGVLRCHDCAGIDPGQADASEGVPPAGEPLEPIIERGAW